MLLGPADSNGGFRRLDVGVTRSVDGGLHIEVDVPDKLAPSAAGLPAGLSLISPIAAGAMRGRIARFSMISRMARRIDRAEP